MLTPALLLLLALSTAPEAPPGSGAPEADVPAGAPKAEPKTPEKAAGEPETVRVSESVVVTATRTERAASELPVSASVVSRETIRETPTRTVDDLVRTVPGLNLPLTSSRTSYPTYQTFSARGVGPGRGLVLVDGIPINDPFFGSTQWQKVPVASLERVEAVRGGGSSLFGNLAMGGTLQLVSRRIEESGAAVDLAYGSYATLLGTARAEARLSPDVALGLTVDGYHSDGYIRTVPGNQTPLDEPYANEGIVGQLRADLGRAGGARGFVRTSLFESWMSQGTPLGFNERRIADVAAGATVPAGALGELSATAFYQDQRVTLHSAASKPGTGGTAEYLLAGRDTPTHDMGGSIQWSRGFSGVVPLLAAGLDLRQSDGEDQGHEYDQTGRETVFRTSGGKQRFAGFFAEASIVPAPRLEILVSARVDSWLSFDGRTTSTTGAPVDYPDASRTTFDPRLSIRYGLAEGLSARAGVYRGFRAPSLGDLYRYALNRAQQVQPNPALGPETMVGGEVGFDLARGPVTGQLNVFQNRVEDLVARVLIATKPIVTVQPQNVAASRSQGVEAMSEVALSPRLAFQIGYTFTDAVLTDNPADRSVEGNEVPDVSRHLGSASLRYRHPSGLLASLRGRAWSRRYTDASNTSYLPGAAVFDLLLSYPAIAGLDVTASVENFLDRRYLVEVAAVGPRTGEPLQVLFGVRWRTPSRGAP